MYTPLAINQQNKSAFKVSSMPKQGLNLEDLSQVMNTEYGLVIKNYIPQRYGLDKRKGLELIMDRAQNTPITLFKYFQNDIFIFGYGTKVEAFNMSTGAFTTIKSNFTSGTFDGARAGEYFLVCNGIEKIWRIDNTLAITEIAASPVSTGLAVLGTRVFTWKGTTVQYSEVDDGTDPPFNGWSIGTLATDGAKVTSRNTGDIRSVLQLGPNYVCFSDDGYFAFSIEQIDSAGTLTKLDVPQDYIEDFGGGRGAISTPYGIFYVNEAGLWQMVATGQVNVPASQQKILTSTLLGSKFFKNIDLSSCDLVHDEAQELILVTCADGSASNNLVIGCSLKTKNKAFFTISNWHVSRFTKIGQTIYGASSINTKAWEIFKGYSDDGTAIPTEYYQEIPMDGLFLKNKLKDIYAGGFLSNLSELTISFDIYDVNGKPVLNKAKYLWTAQRVSSSFYGWGTGSWGLTAFGGDVDLTGLVESFDGGSPRINNMQRLRVRIKGSDEARHIVNWLAVGIETKSPIKRRKITQIS